MAKKKVGDLIKEARTNANMTQAVLAKKVGISASDLSKAERNEKTLTQQQLKDIAKATGVTQKSLLEAASSSSSTSTSSSASTTTMKLTAAEKRLVEYYRQADSETKKAAVSLLKGEKSDMGDMLSTLLNNKDIKNALGAFLKKEG